MNSSLADVRASIHGDVLHARPVVVNYGGSTGIVGFYGSNDGMLRAIKGGIADSDGLEKWAFIPEEFLSYTKLSRPYNNTNIIRFPNQACSITPAPTKRDYFWDGPMGIYQTSDGTPTTLPSKTWLYATMRRGGRTVYALDVTNPDVPKFKWRINNSTTGFSELGQTWSEPKVTKLKGVAAVGGAAQSQLVVAFGAGYDATVEDRAPGSARTVTMGRGVFVVDADTGAKVALLQPPTGVQGYSFAGDVTLVDLDGDGYLDRIYAADTGGNIYRFDAQQSADIGDPANYWKSYIVAKLGDVDNDGGTDARKFLFAPEVLLFRSNNVVKAMVLAGSGDREHPLPNVKADGSANTLACGAYYSDAYYGAKVSDRFFGVVDSIPTGAPDTVNASPIQVSNLVDVNSGTSGFTSFSVATDTGWFIELKNDPQANGLFNEEKTVNAARVVGGTVFFSTSTPVPPNPSAGVCTNLGEALGYAVDPFTGQPALDRDGSGTKTRGDYAAVFAGGGLPPTVTAGVVAIGGTPYRFSIGTGGSGTTADSSISGQRNLLNLVGKRSRLYWSYGADSAQ
jgi:Tfp pilus tip-associated adhesin PilY1